MSNYQLIGHVLALAGWAAAIWWIVGMIGAITEMCKAVTKTLKGESPIVVNHRVPVVVQEPDKAVTR